MDSLNNPEHIATLLEEIDSQNDFAYRQGIRMTRITAEQSEGIVDATEDAYNPLDIVHGGFLYTFADTVAGVAIWALTGHSHITLDSSVHFLRPAKAGRLRAVAKPVKLGRQVCVYTVEIYDADEKKVMYATLTFFQKDQPNP